MKYNEPKLFYEPIDKPYSIMKPLIPGAKGEMSREDQATICALIRDNSPKKVLEVGVAAGGTTAVVMNCLQMVSFDAQMYSVDLNTRYYRAPEKAETGYLYRQTEKEIDFKIKHEFLLGKSLPFWLDKIGGDIDFLILDTVHSMPGELLDFLCILPYLSDGAIVVVHDVNLNLIARSYTLFHQYATKILLTTVSSSEKYLNAASMQTNIAAFRVDESTRENIEDLFAALTITWQYIPDAQDIKKYAATYHMQYGDVLDGGWLKFLFYHQEKTIARRFINASKELSNIKSVIVGYDNLYLYGTGLKSKKMYELLGNATIKGCVVSDEYEFSKQKNDKCFQTISEVAEDIDFIILAADSVDCYWKIIELEIPHLVISDAFWEYYHCL